MIVLNEWDTIKLLLDSHGSISRYGDGEFRLCLTGNAKSQINNPQLQKRLRNILKSSLINHVVGIPRIYESMADMTVEKRNFWIRYTGTRHIALLDSRKVYGSAFITRPDAARDIDCMKYYELVKQLWYDKRVLIMQGASSGFAKDESLFNTASSWSKIYGPDTNAFREYDYLLQLLLSNSDGQTVIVLSLGPTATVLAYDLHAAGRQALDLGHLGMFYNHTHPKDAQYG